MQTIKLNGREHILKDVVRYGVHPDPNFAGTGKALCGVLKKGQSLEDWEKQKAKRMKKYEL